MRETSIESSIPHISIDWLWNNIFSKILTDSHMIHDLELLVIGFSPISSSSIVGKSLSIFFEGSKSSHVSLFFKNENLFVVVSEVEGSNSPRKPTSNDNNVIFIRIFLIVVSRLREESSVISSFNSNFKGLTSFIPCSDEKITFFFQICHISILFIVPACRVRGNKIFVQGTIVV